MRPVSQLAPSAPASQPPPGRSAPPDAAAGFAAVLDTQKPRTAVAEGQTPKRPTGAQDRKATTSPATPDARDVAAGAPQTSTTTDARQDVTEGGAPPAPALPVLVDQAPAALAVVPVRVTVTPAVVPVPTASTPA